MGAIKAVAESPESLGKLLLVDHLLTDPIVRLVPRAIDTTWSLNKIIGLPITGFNSLKGSIFYPAMSPMAKWLQNPRGPVRVLNENDWLLQDVITAVHDYLHVWAVYALKEILPKSQFGIEPITPKNFEDFVFCHIVTEVAATLGTDYWFLCTLDLNQECNIGTGWGKKGYGTSYHESDLPEFQKFNPDLVVQDPSFFHRIVDIYVRDYMPGFEERAIVESPKVRNWLFHEIEYGEIGRRWTRRWFEHHSEGRVHVDADKAAAPLSIDKPWKRTLIDGMCQMLWEKTKRGKIHTLSKKFDFRSTWSYPKKRAPDFRFTNLNKVRPAQLDFSYFPKPDRFEFQCFFYQLVANCDYEAFDKQLTKLFPEILMRQDMGLALSLFKNAKRVKECPDEPYDLFVLP